MASQPSPVPEPRLPPPERYGGDPGTCRAFLTACEMHFALQPRTYATERARVAFVISHLTGPALQWGTTAWSARSPFMSSFTSLKVEMERLFDRTRRGAAAGRELTRIRQGTRSVAEYAIEFQTLSAGSNWNSQALCDAFLEGLADRIKDHLLFHELPRTPEGVADLALRIDNRLEETSARLGRRHPKPDSKLASPPTTSQASSTPESEPMQVGRSRLSREERDRRMQSRACLYCGQQGHFLAKCPVKANAH